MNCPVSLLKEVEGTEYALSFHSPSTQDSSRLDAIICAAKACCPDALIRLEALGDWPVESLSDTRTKDRLGDTAHAQDIEQAIANLRIGPVPD